jgi:hypothetical protein
MKIDEKGLDKFEKEADKLAAAIVQQSKIIDQAEKASPVAKKTLAPVKKAIAVALKQSRNAQKAISTAKKKKCMDEKANKDLQVQASKAVKTASAAKKLISHEVSHVVQQAVPKAKPKVMEKTFDEKLKFWQNLEKQTKLVEGTGRACARGFCEAGKACLFVRPYIRYPETDSHRLDQSDHPIRSISVSNLQIVRNQNARQSVFLVQI